MIILCNVHSEYHIVILFSKTWQLVSEVSVILVELNSPTCYKKKHRTSVLWLFLAGKQGSFLIEAAAEADGSSSTVA